jgi:Na+(H+)/acetate symporter ActP
MEVIKAIIRAIGYFFTRVFQFILLIVAFVLMEYLVMKTFTFSSDTQRLLSSFFKYMPLAVFLVFIIIHRIKQMRSAN